MKTLIVTATPPTTNGDLHVGHLSGPYLAADVFARYQRMAGNRVGYLCSGDDNQSYVVTTAARLGKEPADVVTHYTAAVKNTLERADIAVDLFSNSLANAQHTEDVQRFFRDLYDKGVLVARDTQLPFCTPCDRYLFESYIKGRCPFCKEDAAGNLCEACGRINDPMDLIEPRCGKCGEAPSGKDFRGIYFDLEGQREALKEVYASRTTWRPHVRAMCDWLVSKPIADYPVSYPSGWGIPVPVEGFEGQVINVWFEMYPGHLATTKAWRQQHGDPAAERIDDYTLVQFLGYDNSFFNAVLHTASALTAGGGHPLPEHVITNEFYLLDGQKFSTSRNHALWGTELLDQASSDTVRFYLARTNPEQWQTNFALDEFRSTVDNELVGLWSGVLDEFVGRVRDDLSGRLQIDPVPDLYPRGLFSWAKKELASAYDLDEFSLRRASAALLEYGRGIEQYLRRSVLPLRDRDTATYHEALSSLGYLLRGLAYFAQPLLPGFAQRLYSALGYEGAIADQSWEDSVLPEPVVSELKPPEEWFPVG